MQVLILAVANSARLAVRNKKQAIARERELFSEIAKKKIKTFRVQRRPVW